MVTFEAADSFFVDQIEKHSDRSCIITGNAEYSYNQVLALGDEIFARLPAERQLVFIEGDNSVFTIAAYIGALRGRHVVHILDPGKAAGNRELIDRYRPNAVVRCSDDQWTVEAVNGSAIPLHPELAVLLSTSGSTGSSKFVKLSRRNVEANTASIVEYLELTETDRAITVLKPFYSYGFSVINTHLSVGGSIVLTHSAVQDPQLWDRIGDAGVTNLAGVPHTFQVMRTMQIPWADLPDLRFMTQAGGRLNESIVRHFVDVGREHGWSFFVMYGQTEGSPRLSYLPPEKAATYPSSIGIAVPGGTLGLIDERGDRVTEPVADGELTYSGDNVMVGYATSPDDLAAAEQIPVLITGDLAHRNEEGLYFITGRKSRFVKPLGIRVSLDEVESHLSAGGRPCAVVGHDERIVAVFEGAIDSSHATKVLASRYNLPPAMIRVESLSAIPRLANGKVDHQEILRAVEDATGDSISTGSFLKVTLQEFVMILLGRSQEILSASHAFSLVFPALAFTSEDSFLSIGGDSLKYVQLSSYLEQYLGSAPDGWHEMSISALEHLRKTVDV